MNKGDIVRVKPNHHHPSRVGQTAKIIAVTTTGEKYPTNQYFLVYEKDNIPDTMYESDLELIDAQVPEVPDFETEMIRDIEHEIVTGKKYLEL